MFSSTWVCMGVCVYFVCVCLCEWLHRYYPIVFHKRMEVQLKNEWIYLDRMLKEWTQSTEHKVAMPTVNNSSKAAPLSWSTNPTLTAPCGLWQLVGWLEGCWGCVETHILWVWQVFLQKEGEVKKKILRERK